MEVQINMLAVVLATLSTMVVGSVWYAPKVFGNRWMELVHLDKKKQDKGAAKAIAITLVVSFLTSYVVAHVAYLSYMFFGHSWLATCLQTAIWLWAGLVAARFVTHDAFEQRPWQLTLMNVTHELVTLFAIALVLAVLPPNFAGFPGL